MADIPTAQAEARQRLASLEAEANALALSTTDPDDPKLAELDTAIEKTQATLRRLERLAQGHHLAQTEAQKAAARKSYAQAYAEAVRIAKDRVDLAVKIDAAIAKVGALFEQWDEMGKACHREACTLHRDDQAVAWQYALLDSARGNNHRFTSALEWALFRSGIGNKGVHLPTTQRRPLGAPFGLADAARHVADDLEYRLRDCLKQATEREGV